jgi:hypothetical protein
MTDQAHRFGPGRSTAHAVFTALKKEIGQRFDMREPGGSPALFRKCPAMSLCSRLSATSVAHDPPLVARLLIGDRASAEPEAAASARVAALVDRPTA